MLLTLQNGLWLSPHKALLTIEEETRGLESGPGGVVALRYFAWRRANLLIISVLAALALVYEVAVLTQVTQGADCGDVAASGMDRPTATNMIDLSATDNYVQASMCDLSGQHVAGGATTGSMSIGSGQTEGFRPETRFA